VLNESQFCGPVAVNVDFVMSIIRWVMCYRLYASSYGGLVLQVHIYIGILWSEQLFFVQVTQQEVVRGVHCERGKKNGCHMVYLAVCRFSRILGRFQFVQQKMPSFKSTIRDISSYPYVF
jgi:hypothetical protein